MIEPSDYNDNTILSATRYNRNAQGQVQYICTLPSGRTLTSEWMREEEADRSAVLWCDKVREQITLDMEERRAKIKAKSHGLFASAAAGSPQPVLPTAQETRTADVGGTIVEAEDPEELVIRTILRTQDQVLLLLDQIDTLQEQLDKAQKNLAQWKAIADGLGINLKGENDDESTDSEEALDVDDSGESTASDSSDLRDSGVD